MTSERAYIKIQCNLSHKSKATHRLSADVLLDYVLHRCYLACTAKLLWNDTVLELNEETKSHHKTYREEMSYINTDSPYNVDIMLELTWTAHNI